MTVFSLIIQIDIRQHPPPLRLAPCCSRHSRSCCNARIFPKRTPNRSCGVSDARGQSSWHAFENWSRSCTYRPLKNSPRMLWSTLRQTASYSSFRTTATMGHSGTKKKKERRWWQTEGIPRNCNLNVVRFARLRLIWCTTEKVVFVQCML